MELEFMLALVTAAVMFILTLVFGEDIRVWFSTASAVLVLMPILFTYIAAALGMLNADAETAQIIADSTITGIASYVSSRLPGIIIAELAGSIVGTLGGAVLGMARGY